jgi:hypothetical protein
VHRQFRDLMVGSTAKRRLYTTGSCHDTAQVSGPPDRQQRSRTFLKFASPICTKHFCRRLPIGDLPARGDHEIAEVLTHDMSYQRAHVPIRAWGGILGLVLPDCANNRTSLLQSTSKQPDLIGHGSDLASRPAAPTTTRSAWSDSGCSGLVAAGALGVLEWPVAAAVGIGSYVAEVFAKSGTPADAPATGATSGTPADTPTSG